MLIIRTTEVHLLNPPRATARHAGNISLIAAVMCTLIATQITYSGLLLVATFIVSGVLAEWLLGSRLGRVAVAGIFFVGLAWGVYLIKQAPVERVPTWTIDI